MTNKTDRELLVEFQNKCRVDKIWNKSFWGFNIFFSIVGTLIYSIYTKIDFGNDPFVPVASSVATLSLIAGIYYCIKALKFNPNDFTIPDHNFKV